MAPSQRRQELITNQKADPYKVCLFLKEGVFPLIQLLIRTFVKNYKSTADRAVRTAYGNLACIVSVVCNLLLAGGKIAVGVLTGSVAITADGMNNLSDASSNVVSLVGFKLGARPADSEHPYGHARYEYLAGLAVSVMILGIGVELLKESFAKVLHPTEVAFSWLMVAVLIASILVKLWMSRLNRQIGTAIDSETLLATAADARNDVITTAAVLAATILTKLTGFARIDGLMGIGVAAFILYSGAMLIKDTINPLLGAAPDSDLVEHIEKKALSYPGVLGVHDLMIHDYGPGSRLVSFHLEMDAKDDVMHSHDVIDRIERDLLVQDGRIAQIAPGITEPADQVIDATGKAVTPGFVDIHRHHDAKPLNDPHFGEVELAQGITTAVAGNCGIIPLMKPSWAPSAWTAPTPTVIIWLPCTRPRCL